MIFLRLKYQKCSIDDVNYVAEGKIKITLLTLEHTDLVKYGNTFSGLEDFFNFEKL